MPGILGRAPRGPRIDRSLDAGFGPGAGRPAGFGIRDKGRGRFGVGIQPGDSNYLPDHGFSLGQRQMSNPGAFLGAVAPGFIGTGIGIGNTIARQFNTPMEARTPPAVTPGSPVQALANVNARRHAGGLPPAHQLGAIGQFAAGQGAIPGAGAAPAMGAIASGAARVGYGQPMNPQMGAIMAGLARAGGRGSGGGGGGGGLGVGGRGRGNSGRSGRGRESR